MLQSVSCKRCQPIANRLILYHLIQTTAVRYKEKRHPGTYFITSQSSKWLPTTDICYHSILLYYRQEVGHGGHVQPLKPKSWTAECVVHISSLRSFKLKTHDCTKYTVMPDQAQFAFCVHCEKLGDMHRSSSTPNALLHLSTNMQVLTYKKLVSFLYRTIYLLVEQKRP